MLKRCIASTKHRKYLAAKAQETMKDFVKSKKLKVVCPMVSTTFPLCNDASVAHTSYRTIFLESPYSSRPTHFPAHIR
jgi:hypothetical protein